MKVGIGHSIRVGLVTPCALAIAVGFGQIVLEGPAYAQGGVIYACINPGGNPRLVAASHACKPTEERVQWNVTGPKGDTGPAGLTGLTGATGPLGPKGATGETGPQGVAGPQGVPGPVGSAGAIVGQLESCVAGFDFSGILIHVPGRAFSVFSGPTGRFQIDNLPVGTYNLAVVRAGGLPVSVSGIVVGDSVHMLEPGVLISDTASDTSNCGACGSFCDGTCSAGTCRAPDDDGVGTACNVPLPPPAGAPSQCKAGMTVRSVSGELVCVGSVGPSGPVDACGVDANCDGALTSQPNLMIDVNNCGSCGNDCRVGSPDRIWACVTGMCSDGGLIPDGAAYLSWSFVGDGGGSISLDPQMIGLPTRISYHSYDRYPAEFYFPPGHQTTLMATADATSQFVGWAGACTGTGPCVLTMDTSRSVTAIFTALPR